MEGRDLFVCGNYVFNHYRDCQDANYFLCGDKINDVLCLPYQQRPELAPILACQDRVLRILTVSHRCYLEQVLRQIKTQVPRQSPMDIHGESWFNQLITYSEIHMLRQNSSNTDVEHEWSKKDRSRTWWTRYWDGCEKGLVMARWTATADVDKYPDIIECYSFCVRTRTYSTRWRLRVRLLRCACLEITEGQKETKFFTERQMGK